MAIQNGGRRADRIDREVVIDEQHAHDLPNVTPAVRALTRDLTTYERREELSNEQYRAMLDREAAQARLAQLDAAAERSMFAHVRFQRSLGAVYHDPEHARLAFMSAATERGLERAEAMLREHPERFGTLLSVSKPVAFGLWHQRDDHQARGAATEAAVAAHQAVHAERALPEVAASVRASRLDMEFAYELRNVHRFATELGRIYREPAKVHNEFELLAGERGSEYAADTMRRHPWLFGELHADSKNPEIRHAIDRTARLGMEGVEAGRQIPATEAKLARDTATLTRSPEVASERAMNQSALSRAAGRERHAAAELARLPGGPALERRIAETARRLSPTELGVLERVVTASQLLVAVRLRDAARTMVLGKDVGQER